MIPVVMGIFQLLYVLSIYFWMVVCKLFSVHLHFNSTLEQIVTPFNCPTCVHVEIQTKKMMPLKCLSCDVLPFFISCYPSQHESIYNVGCPSHVTVRGLQDYMQLNRTELLSVVRKWNVYSIFIIQSQKQKLLHHSEGVGLILMMKHGNMVVWWLTLTLSVFSGQIVHLTQTWSWLPFRSRVSTPSKSLCYMKTTTSCNCNNFSVLLIRDGTNRIEVCVVLGTAQGLCDMIAWRMVLSHTQRL